MKNATRNLLSRATYAVASVSPGTYAVALALGGVAFALLSLAALARQAGILTF
jgi:hypothetical protein